MPKRTTVDRPASTAGDRDGAPALRKRARHLQRAKQSASKAVVTTSAAATTTAAAAAPAVGLRRSPRDPTAAGSEFFRYTPWPFPVEAMRAVASRALRRHAEGPPLVARPGHPTRGRCVHAVRAIAAGSFVREYDGELLTTAAAAEARAKQYASAPDPEERDRSFMFYFRHSGRPYCVDATASPHIAKLVNHSRMEANLRPIKCIDPATRIPRIVLMALRIIAKGEELFFDYGEIDPAVRARLPFLDT